MKLFSLFIPFTISISWRFPLILNNYYFIAWQWKTIYCLGKGIPAFPLPEHLNVQSYPNCGVKPLKQSCSKMVLCYIRVLRSSFSRVFLYAWSRPFSISADLMILQALSPKEQQTSGMRDVRMWVISENKRRSNFLVIFVLLGWTDDMRSKHG